MLPQDASNSLSGFFLSRPHLKIAIVLGLLGAIFIGLGVIALNPSISEKAELVVATNSPQSKIIVEIAGEVVKPGVYEIALGTRVEELLKLASGFTPNADLKKVESQLNRAAVLKDGQKITIPSVNQQNNNETANNIGEGSDSKVGQVLASSILININTAPQEKLEELWGIGPKIGQKIIEQRPYSSIEELVSKGLIKQNVFERIKFQISVE